MNCHRLALSLALFFIAANVTPIQAAEIPEHYLPVRPLGMGGAFTAVANDENAAWTNPAGVSRVRKARSRQIVSSIRIPNLTIGANSDSSSYFQGFATQRSSVEEFVSQSTSSSVSEDRPYWVAAASFPNIMFDIEETPVLLGFYNYSRGRLLVDAATPTNAEMETISDLGGIFSAAITNRSNRASIGASIRTIGRYAFEESIATAELDDPTAMQERLLYGYNQSFGYALDVGVLFTFADFWFPSFGASILNLPLGCKEDYLNPYSKLREPVCGTAYVGSFANEDALSVVDPLDARIGFSIAPRLSRELGLRLAADIHHLPIDFQTGTIYGLQDIGISRMIHGGIEIYSGNPLQQGDFSVRVGMNQTFYTFGATLIAGPLLVEFASYGTDVSSSTKSIEDRRFVGTLSMVF